MKAVPFIVHFTTIFSKQPLLRGKRENMLPLHTEASNKNVVTGGQLIHGGLEKNTNV